MSKLFNQAVKTAFKNEMRVKLPEYDLVQTTGVQIVWPGEIDFCRKTALGHSLWICFCTHYRGENSFMIEVGWSLSGGFPALNARPSLIRPYDKGVFSQHEYLTRLSMISIKDDYWWSFSDGPTRQCTLQERISMEIDFALKSLTKEEAERSAQILVPKAMETLIQYGVPFLNAFADGNRK